MNFKQKIVLLFIFLFSAIAFSQDAVKVTYSFTLEMEIPEYAKNNPEDLKAYKEMLDRIEYYELKVVNNKSNFKIIEKINNEPKEMGNSVSIKPAGAESYQDTDNNRLIMKVVHFSLDTYAYKPLDIFDWELTREKEKILNFETRKAIAEDKYSTIEVWYAPSLPFKNGPLRFSGLPGLILKVVETSKNKNKRKFLFTATDVEMMENDTKLNFPKEDEMMSYEEFEVLYKDMNRKMDEMRNQGVDTSD